MLKDISILSIAGLQDRIGPHCNPHLTLAVSGSMAPDSLHFAVTDISAGRPHDRVLSAITYLKHLHSILPEESRSLGRDFNFIFQAEDVPSDYPSASWETKIGWNDIVLVPDLYYFNAQGYEDSFVEVVPWDARDSRIVWRGSTTGLFHQRLEDLDRLPRYRLCEILSKLGVISDVGLNAVVQGLNPEEEDLIRQRLMAENIFKPFLPMNEMMSYRYVLDIDGNSNSWNFMQKLRLGCCVLRVESDWHQWFKPRLLPWVHYVPITNDLSDLVEKIEWCFDHERECAAIAAQGAEFARSMRFHDEMARAASDIFVNEKVVS